MMERPASPPDAELPPPVEQTSARLEIQTPETVSLPVEEGHFAAEAISVQPSILEHESSTNEKEELFEKNHARQVEILAEPDKPSAEAIGSLLAKAAARQPQLTNKLISKPKAADLNKPTASKLRQDFKILFDMPAYRKAVGAGFV